MARRMKDRSKAVAVPEYPSWMTDAERQAADRFPKDVANHLMTVLHDDGLYRHLRFAQPEHGWYWFDIITWPGSLAVRGDMGGGYVFSRITDMFEFFRRNGNSAGINPGYWAEKLPDYGKSVKAYSETVFRTMIEACLAEYEKDIYPELLAEYQSAMAAYDAAPARERWPIGDVKEPGAKPKSLDELRRLIADYDADGDLTHDAGARELLKELERAGVASDTWEWSLTDWDWTYLWFCHAIVWGIAQYDARPRPWWKRWMRRG